MTSGYYPKADTDPIERMQQFSHSLEGLLNRTIIDNDPPEMPVDFDRTSTVVLIPRIVPRIGINGYSKVGLGLVSDIYLGAIATTVSKASDCGAIHFKPPNRDYSIEIGPSAFISDSEIVHGNGKFHLAANVLLRLMHVEHVRTQQEEALKNIQI